MEDSFGYEDVCLFCIVRRRSHGSMDILDHSGFVCRCASSGASSCFHKEVCAITFAGVRVLNACVLVVEIAVVYNTYPP